MNQILVSLDFENLERQRDLLNFASMDEEIEKKSSRLTNRIALYSKRSGVSEEEFWAELDANPRGPLAATLARQARRQNIYETIAAEYLSRIDHIDQLQSPPKSRSARNPLFVDDAGRLVTAKELGSDAKPSAPIDFRWKTGNLTCYGAQKYTKEGGGHQNGQYNDIINLLRNFQKHTEVNTVLFVLVDGRYFNQNRINRLKEFEQTEKPRSFVLSINEVGQTLNQIVDAGYTT